MNDWRRIEAALLANDGISESQRERAWNWSELARAWLDENGIDARTVTRGDMLRFEREVPPTKGPKNEYQRRWAFKLLVTAACDVSPAVARRPDSLAGRVDGVPARSPLGKAIARVIATAKTDGDRRRLATCLGAFLMWCDSKGLCPEDCWPGDLAVYRRDRIAEGYTAPGEYLRVAGLLLAELNATPSS